MSDPVNHPKHYQSFTVEAIDAIEASMSREEFCGYLKANCIKYLWRYKIKNKDNPVQDLEKCEWYLKRLITTEKLGQIERD